jgi:hypothetical protein
LAISTLYSDSKVGEINRTAYMLVTGYLITAKITWNQQVWESSFFLLTIRSSYCLLERVFKLESEAVGQGLGHLAQHIVRSGWAAVIKQLCITSVQHGACLLSFYIIVRLASLPQGAIHGCPVRPVERSRRLVDVRRRQPKTVASCKHIKSKNNALFQFNCCWYRRYKRLLNSIKLILFFIEKGSWVWPINL